MTAPIDSTLIRAGVLTGRVVMTFGATGWRG